MTATMRALILPDATGRLTRYTLRGNASKHAASMRPRWNRVAFAAAHVVSDPLANVDPWLATAIDWDATLAYRRYLWDWGLGVAEAMDTAQRGMGLTGLCRGGFFPAANDGAAKGPDDAAIVQCITQGSCELAAQKILQEELLLITREWNG